MSPCWWQRLAVTGSRASGSLRFPAVRQGVSLSPGGGEGGWDKILPPGETTQQTHLPCGSPRVSQSSPYSCRVRACISPPAQGEGLLLTLVPRGPASRASGGRSDSDY